MNLAYLSLSFPLILSLEVYLLLIILKLVNTIKQYHRTP
jgi:hypothetical protein